eukprot:TRINITY_DN40159_c0_g1_i1.p1 TRINITY_DN40159_c0_g1~~TRINITY_DN40159_c0_g1_i1.p1  ORF type:complete len:262 (+),score=46.76 TRINITY_DN40159_c0_g1_i1:50-835(+)
MSIPTFHSYPAERGSPSARSGNNWEATSTSEQDERIRLLTRLSDKLLSNREFEEKERYINELARQESELQHLKETIHEQAQQFEERGGVIKMHENTIQQLQLQLVEARQEKDNQIRNLDSTVNKLLGQVRELESQRGETTRKYESQVQQLQKEIELGRNSRGGAGGRPTGEETMLRQQLAASQEEISKLKAQVNAANAVAARNAANAKSSAVAPKTGSASPTGEDEVLIEEVAEEPVAKIERPQATPQTAQQAKPSIPDEF